MWVAKTGAPRWHTVGVGDNSCTMTIQPSTTSTVLASSKLPPLPQFKQEKLPAKLSGSKEHLSAINEWIKMTEPASLRGKCGVLSKGGPTDRPWLLTRPWLRCF